jgi:hypothetical protein
MFTQIQAFYKFVGDIARIHHDNSEHKENFFEEFREVLLYRLMKEKGVKRKLNGNTIQLFYDKKEKGYNRDDPVTQLCRSLIIDANTLRIISIGVPKSYSLEDFKMEHPEISQESGYQLQNYPDGTMLMVCPELSKYDTTIVDTVHTEKSEESEQETQIVRDVNISTRRKLGTGYFDNSSKTFAELFRDNFGSSGIDFDAFVAAYPENYCFVFNVQHREHRMITPDVSVNTLIKMFKTKSKETADAEFAELITSLGTDKFTDNLTSYYSNMVLEVPAVEFQDYDFVRDMTTLTSISMDNMTWSAIDEMVSRMNDYEQGVCVVSPDGIRTKVRNPKYTKLRELKGFSPISLLQENRLNVFKLFWRLRNVKGNISEFCKYFDTDGKYMIIFNDFRDELHKFTNTLFKTYHQLNVEKSITSDQVPWHMWPLCCELHRKYRVERVKIYPPVVYTYINTIPVLRLYERIFDPVGMKERYEMVKLMNESEAEAIAIKNDGNTEVAE